MGGAGKLHDVTNTVNNNQRRRTPLTPPKPKMNISTPKDRGYRNDPTPPGFVHPFKAMVEGIPTTPNYLSPKTTYRSQSGAIKVHQPVLSPLTAGPNAKGRQWVASAARRVGFSRVQETAKPSTEVPEQQKSDTKNSEVRIGPTQCFIKSI